jgi:UDP-2-acetamido-3-amino-2,3-dideoxy-glucuronate N-acetyltransferase
VPPYAIVVGNPARIRGYVGAKTGPPLAVEGARDAEPSESAVAGVRGVRLIPMPIVEDLRGALSHAEIGKQLPFEPKRYFLIYDVPTKEVRGEHAHRRLEQLLVSIRGEVAVVVDDGEARAQVVLDSPHQALYLPPMTWGTQYRYTPDAVLLVLASEKYDPDDYIRDYAEFRRLAAGE